MSSEPSAVDNILKQIRELSPSEQEELCRQIGADNKLLSAIVGSSYWREYILMADDRIAWADQLRRCLESDLQQEDRDIAQLSPRDMEQAAFANRALFQALCSEEKLRRHAKLLAHSLAWQQVQLLRRNRQPSPQTLERDRAICKMIEEEGMTPSEVVRELPQRNPAWALDKQGKRLKASAVKAAHQRIKTKKQTCDTTPPLPLDLLRLLREAAQVVATQACHCRERTS